ncbi:hypothetical protein [Paractinoplanes brasiliensis]|nr:hypothetical protein [Actinoplanes brasiliensis]
MTSLIAFFLPADEVDGSVDCPQIPARALSAPPTNLLTGAARWSQVIVGTTRGTGWRR